MSAPIEIPQSNLEPVASTLKILQLREAPSTSGTDSSAASSVTSAAHPGEAEKPAAPATVSGGREVFAATSLPQIRRVYGGEIAAQALLAAGATVETGRLPHSLHLYFVRGADSKKSLTFEVERTLDGRSFTNRHVTGRQDGKPILQLDASFKASETSLDWAPAAPTATSPESLESSTSLFQDVDHPMARLIGDDAAFEVRHVEPAVYLEPDPQRRPEQLAWMRPRQVIPGNAREHQLLHRTLLLYAIDQIMLEPALRVAGLYWLSPGLSMASLQHSQWFKGEVDVNQWLLFHGTCDFVADGRAKAHVNVFDETSTYLGSAAQEGMLRIPTEGRSGSGTWGFGAPPQAHKAE